ncbi:hypothetical protein BFP97_12495 [Roseivirga sp. 4D4]|uniref:hypothetical protein n=1 Tax=Roseivirga sp. 4D4 TaxID=1889784 RepID=UPI000853CEA8|nr:hypothetical protein [Roseivirga sp. 4D4]OEK02287.1 hypothetical protein BFP97_12495 [Roseivirga sp. 4D4]
MRNLLIFFICCLLTSPAFAQESLQDESLEISTQSLEKANKKVQKEIDKLSKRLRKSVSELYPDLPVDKVDSLVSAMAAKKEAIQGEAKDSVTNYLQTLKQDLLADLKETPEKLPVADKIRESVEKLEELKQMQGLLKDKDQLVEMLDVSEIKKLNKQVVDLKGSFEEYKSQFDGWEDKLLEEVTNLPQAQLLKEQAEKMKAYKPLPEGYRDDMGQFQTNDFVKEKLEAKAEEFKKIGETTLQEKFDQAQTKITEAKQKFPSLESLEDAPKRYNPHKDKPFLQRIILGGNLQVNRQEPVSADLSLSLTYPLGLKSAIGVSGGTRVFLEKAKVVRTRDQATGFRAFYRHTLYKSFYLQANYEVTKLRTEDLNDNQLGEQWVKTALLGIGKKFTIAKKIQMNFGLFYDLFFDATQSPNDQAWVMRLGFDLKKDK